MSQKGTFGLLMVGGGIVVGWLTLSDLFNSSASVGSPGTGSNGQSPFSPTNLANPPFANPKVQQTTCPAGQVSVAKSGASTQRICVPASQQNRIGQNNKCPPGQTWVPVGGGTTGMCYGGGPINVGRAQGQPYQPPYVSKNYSPRPCYFGWLLC